jgi:hypothetical protein
MRYELNDYEWERQMLKLIAAILPILVWAASALAAEASNCLAIA